MDAKPVSTNNIRRFSFNPRARDGREVQELTFNKAVPVSIHAPVMDANMLYVIHCFNDTVSIHAPVMDAKK